MLPSRPPDLTTFTRLDVLGLEVTAQLLEPDRTVLACRVVEPDDWCRRCGCQGVPRDTVTRELAHEPFGWRPTTLLLTVRRYRCTECAHVWRQDTTAAAEPRAKISRAGLRWGLVGIVVQHLSMARVAEGLGVSWNTAPQSSHPQDPYILCLTASPQHPRYALRIRKSHLTTREKPCADLPSRQKSPGQAAQIYQYADLTQPSVFSREVR